MANRTKSQRKRSKAAHAAKRNVHAPGHCAGCGKYLTAKQNAYSGFCSAHCANK